MTSHRIETLAEGVTLYLGDCREILPTLGKVDAVVTDPPYFLPVNTYVGTRTDGNYARMLGDLSVLEGYFKTIFDEIEAHMNVGASWYIFCDAKSYPIFWRVLFPKCKHVRLVIWDKMVSYNGYTWRHQHELIAWGECEGAERVPTGEGDIIQERGVPQEDRVHPAQKPESVYSRLIRKTPKGCSILDPYMGSGSGGVAAIGLDRRFIGIEIEPKYFEIALRRIQAALDAPDMFIEKPKPVKQESLINPSHSHGETKARHGDDLAGEVVTK